jgi:2-isopropylmalate synthase
MLLSTVFLANILSHQRKAMMPNTTGIVPDSETNRQLLSPATVRLSRNGATMQDAAIGDGPVAAVLHTIDRLTGIPGKLVDYAIQAVSAGKDAQGEVSVRVQFAEPPV